LSLPLAWRSLSVEPAAVRGWLKSTNSRKVHCMKTVFVLVAVVVGLVFLGLAALYWLTPAGELPAFLPGFREGATDIHVKHALGSLIIGLAALALAWFRSRAA
jgi:hypothetical protein